MVMTRTASHPRTTSGLRAAGPALAPVGAALLLAACGSASPAQGNGVASKSPTPIVAAAQTALRSADGFVAAGTLSQHGRVARLRIVSGGSSKLEVQVSGRGRSEEIVALAGAHYVRAKLAFWTAQVGPRAASLANRWIELPASESQQLTSSFGLFAPSTMARCIGENLGTLSRGGHTTVAGKSAVVVDQAGNAPGSNPGTLAVATNGPAYPLRITSTGPSRPGGKVDV